MASYPGADAPSPWALEHAGDLGMLPPAPRAGHAEVILLTDPWSVWCWGLEPVRRGLEARYPTIGWTPLVGGMFAELPDPERLGFDVERFFSVVTRSTGQPLRTDATLRDRPSSTYPACEHVAVVRLLRPDLERPYLRRLREAAWIDGRNVSRPDVARDVAASVGVSPEEFDEARASGEPDREFRATLARLHAANLHAYPTLLVRTRDRLARVEGFQTLPGLVGLVEQASARTHAPRPPPGVLESVPPGERVSTREVAEATSLSIERAFEELAALEREGSLLRVRLPNGDFWARA